MKLSERVHRGDFHGKAPELIDAIAQLEAIQKLDKWSIKQLEAELVKCKKLASKYIHEYEKFAIENGLHELKVENERLKKIENATREIVSVRHVHEGIRMAPVTTQLLDALKASRKVSDETSS